MSANKILPKNFDWKVYLEIYSDLKKHNITTKDQAEEHYITHGIKENRVYEILPELPNNFDWRVYNLLNPDIAKHYKNQKDSEWHYRLFGHKENRIFSSVIPYSKLIQHKDTSSLKTFDNINYSIFINHQSNLTGAPLFLQDLANSISGHNNVIFIDCFPNKYFNLNRNIIKAYHFNDAKIIKKILDDTFMINLIYSNSLNPMLDNIDLFKKYLYKTIFHFHECKIDILERIKYDQLSEIVENSYRTVFTAEKILHDCKLKVTDSLLTCPEFIGQKRVKTILSNNNRRKKYNQRPIICMCGTNCDRKNPQLFKELAILNPEYDFLWIGADISQDGIENLTVIPQTQNPAKYFAQIDYFLLTSIRDPCPIVVLENLLMNNKVILLKDNIQYEHKISELENVFLINNHNNCAKNITQQIKKLNLNTIPNKTSKNIEYVLNNFSYKARYKLANKNQYNNYLFLSYFHKKKEDIQYFANLINSKIIFEPEIKEVYIAISGIRNTKNVCKRLKALIHCDNLNIIERENIGFDIGGLLDILKIFPFDHTSDYITYIHNKSNTIWREELYKILYSPNYFKYDTTVCKNHYIKCPSEDLNRNIFSNHHFMSHLERKKFDYISGTCFITKAVNLLPIIDNLDYIQNNLTSIHTNDTFWQQNMSDEKIFNQYYNNHHNSIIYTQIDLESRNTVLKNNVRNFFELQQKYKLTGIPDLMFEHALERYIGYLITNDKTVNLV